MSTPNQHLDFLDRIRGLAILCVFLYHSLGSSFHAFGLPWGTLFRDPHDSVQMLLLYPLSLGWCGVAIFFAISGFCIHLSFVRNQPRDGFQTFFLRRFFRIYPPYLFTLLVFAFAFPPTRLNFHEPGGWTDLLAHVFLVHNFHESTFFSINPSFWSLAVEAQLYAIYPCLLLLAGRWGWQRTLVLLGLMEISLRALIGLNLMGCGPELPTWLAHSPLAYWFSWSLGAALAEAWLKGTIPGLARYTWLAALGAAIGCDWFKPASPFSFMFFSLATVAGTASFLGPAPPARVPPPAWLVHLQRVGVCSYSFYLLHQPLLKLAKLPLKLFPHWEFPPLLVLGFSLLTWPLVFLLSRWMFRFVEQSGIRLGKAVILARTKPSRRPQGSN